MAHTVRKYQDRDLQSVLASWESASKLAHPFLSREFIAKERQNIVNIHLPLAETWVAESQGSVVGFIALIGNEVGAIFVEPEHHGKGVGASLMNKAEEIHGDLEVEVFAENSIGRRFYASYGFLPLAEKIHQETGRKLLRLKLTGNKDMSTDASKSQG